MNQDQESKLALKILANPTRFAIISLLSDRKKDYCVNQIAEAVGISQSLASHQLAYLLARDVVLCERMGQTMCYKLTTSSIAKKVVGVTKLLSV